MKLRQVVGRLLGAAIAVLGLQAAALAVPGDVVISQVWGGTSGTAGNANLPKADYVELFNRTSGPVAIDGWSLNIATSSGTSWSKCDLPSFTMPAYSYFLVRVSADTTNGIALPSHDAVFPALTNSTLSTSGKVCLRDTTAPIGSVGCPASNIIDLLTYGSTTATCYEGTGARGPANSTSTSNPLAAFRRGDGCLDTDDNGADFVARTPAPRNMASPISPTCLVGACCDNTTGACVTDTEANCTADGLSFTLVGTACTSNPCPASGACCSGGSTTTCSVVTVAGCAALTGGRYVGDGISCSPSPCANTTSCCFANGTCCAMVSVLCSDQGGTPGAYTVGCTTAGNCLPPVANDLCANAIPLTLNVTQEGNGWGATFTGDGPFAPCLTGQSVSSKGVWFTFTPSVTSNYDIGTCGTTFNSDMVVFTVPNCATPSTWTVVGCSDDGCPNPSLPTFCGASTGATASARIAGIPLQAGQTYHIRLSLNGSLNTGGNYRITVTDLGSTEPAGACCYALNGRCEVRTAASCTDAEVNPVGTYQGDGVACATELCGTGYGACCTGSTGACQMRLATGCTTTGTFWVEDTACDPTPCVIDPNPPNGTCATAAVIADVDFPLSAIVGINGAPAGPALPPLLGCSTSGNPTNNALWYVYTPTVSGVLSAWELGSRDTTVVFYEASPDCSSLTPLGCESTETDANMPVQSGHVYYILFTTTGPASTNVNDFYSLKFNLVVPSVPPNDSCAFAPPIVPDPSLQTFPGGGAAPGPRSECQTLSYQPQEARNAIWFSYTTPAGTDQLARMQRTTAAGFNYFFSLAFFTGTCNDLIPYDCVDLGTADTFVRLRRSTTYYVMVHRRSGYMPGDGQYRFIFDVLTPPQANNQECTSATVIPSLPYTDSVHNVLAFDEDPVTGGACSGNSVQNGSGIWYSFTPSQPVVVTVAETSPQDAAIGVFENSCTNRVLCSALDDETGVPGANTFRAYPGSIYYILVARQGTGLPSQTDTLDISVTGIEVPTPPNDDCFNATPIPSIPFTETTMIGTARDDFPRAVCSRGTITNTSRNGIWYTYTNGFPGRGVVMAETSGLDAIIAAYKGVCGSLLPVMCTDTPESNMYLYMEPNTTYYIFVAQAFDLPAGAGDVISLDIGPAPTTILPPVNDACELAQKVSSLPFVYNSLPLAASHGSVSTCAAQPVSLTLVQATNQLWYTFDSGSGYTLRIWELSGNDVTYALYTACGGIEEVCTTTDGSITTPVFMTLAPGLRYYLQVARQTNSDYTYGAAPYDLTISVADGTPGACCTGTICALSVVEGCSAAFVPGGTCDPMNPVACCPANYNQVNGLEVQDIFDFLNGWFAGTARADFNGNGRLEVQDIFDFLNAWFTGCH